MYFKFSLIITLLLANTITSLAQDKWINSLKNQIWLSPISHIKLLKSTQSDVEKILGKPEYFDEGFLGRDFIKYYPTEYGRVTVKYTNSDCQAKNGIRIPKGVVEEIGLMLLIDIKFSELRLPVNKFKKSVEENGLIKFYTNKNYGIQIEVQNKKVASVTLMPPKALDLQCNNIDQNLIFQRSKN